MKRRFSADEAFVSADPHPCQAQRRQRSFPGAWVLCRTRCINCDAATRPASRGGADLLRRPAHLTQLRLDLTAHRRRELAGLTSYRLSRLSLRFRLLEPITALTSIAAHLSTYRALTDTQNAGDAFLAGSALAQRINLAAILIPYSPVLTHRQPLAISRGYPFVALLNYALAT